MIEEGYYREKLLYDHVLDEGVLGGAGKFSIIDGYRPSVWAIDNVSLDRPRTRLHWHPPGHAAWFEWRLDRSVPVSGFVAERIGCAALTAMGSTLAQFFDHAKLHRFYPLSEGGKGGWVMVENPIEQSVEEFPFGELGPLLIMLLVVRYRKPNGSRVNAMLRHLVIVPVGNEYQELGAFVATGDDFDMANLCWEVRCRVGAAMTMWSLGTPVAELEALPKMQRARLKRDRRILSPCKILATDAFEALSEETLNTLLEAAKERKGPLAAREG
ncbi:MAG: hypothetical protein R3322_00120 [Kiloniellales bacterium]|nr:hypothetical protein [Kiloniellales bacterium]